MSNKKTLDDQLAKTKEKGEQEVIKNKIETTQKQVTEITTIVTTYTETVSKITTEITDMETGKVTKGKEDEVHALEEEGKSVCGDAGKALGELPLVKEESADGKTVVTEGTTAESSHPGVIGGLTIKGDIGGTSTTTGQTDISTQIIEKYDTATKMREEATKIKQVTESQTEEITEIITSETKSVEIIEKTITESKTKLVSMRSKEKELNTKITSATDTTEIESYKKELTTLTTEITTTKTVIKTSTQKKVTVTQHIEESKTKISELKSKVEVAENDASSAEEEAITYISEGVEATYVV
jgi:DNA repair exonuclease SbcCD ATPase subunit